MKTSATLQDNLQATSSTQTINLSSSISLSPIRSRREVASQTDAERANVGIQADDLPVPATLNTLVVHPTTPNSSLSTVQPLRSPTQSPTISPISVSNAGTISSSTLISTSAASSSSSLRANDGTSTTERDCATERVNGPPFVSRIRPRLSGTASSRQGSELAFEGLVQRIFGYSREGDLSAIKILLEKTPKETFRAALHTPSNAAPGPSVTSFAIACKNGKTLTMFE